MKNLCYEDSQVGYIYLASVENFEDSGVVYTYKDAWRQEDVLNTIARQTGTEFAYKMLGTKPVIAAANPENCVNISAYVPIIKSNPEIEDKDLIVLAGQMTGLTGVKLDVDDASTIVDTIRDFLKQQESMSTDLYVCMDSNLPADEEVKTLVSANVGSSRKTYAVIPDNKTLYMNNPSAEVFIKVPTYAELLLYFREGFVELPSKASFMPGYKYPGCETGDYRKYCGDDLILLKEVQGSPENNVNNNEDKFGVDESNLLDENGIFPNELNYYKSICNMLDAAVEAREVVKQQRAEAYGKDMPKTEREFEELPPLSKEDEFSRAVRYYMIWLMERAAVFNWTHTGNVVIYREGSVDIDDSDDADPAKPGKETDYADSGKQFYSSASMSKLSGIDSQEVTALIYDRFIEIDPHSIAEFLIKSLRWGDRKPTKVIFSSSKIDFEFDFEQYSLTRKSFSRANSQKVVKDGVEYYLVGEIKTSDILRCDAYKREIGPMLMSVPIGIVTNRFFATPDGEVTAQQVYMSVIDVLEILKKDSRAIKGVQLNQDGTISVDSGLIQNDISIDAAVRNAYNAAASDLSYKLYESERVLKLALQLSLRDVSSVLYLSLIASLLPNPKLNMMLDGFDFKTLKEGKELCKRTDVSTVVRGKLGNEIVLKVARLLNEAHANGSFTIEESLNCAKSLFDVNKDFIEEKGTVGTASAINALTQKMNLSKNNQEEEMSVKDVMNGAIMGDISKATSFFNLTYGGNVEFTLGVLKTSEGTNEFILGPVMPNVSVIEDKPFVEIAMRIASPLIALPMMSEAKYSKIQYKFADAETHKKFWKMFRTLTLSE